jgi:hypothetical protein
MTNLSSYEAMKKHLSHEAIIPFPLHKLETQIQSNRFSIESPSGFLKAEIPVPLAARHAQSRSWKHGARLARPRKSIHPVLIIMNARCFAYVVITK